MPLTVFGAQDTNSGVELWGTDGTTGRTTVIKNINTVSNGMGGSLSGNVSNTAVGTSAALAFPVIGNFAYFSADDGVNGQELWRTDGTAAGTTKVTEFFTTSGTADPSDNVTGYFPTNIVAANGFIFFIGQGPAAVNPGTTAARSGIWKYDPGTGQTTFIGGDNNDSPIEMIAAGTRIYWTFDGGAGSGLSTSDGVAAAQNLVSTASLNTPPSPLFAAGTTVYYGTGGLSGNIKKVVGTTVTDLTGEPGSPAGYIQTSSHVYIIGSNNTLYVTTTGTTTATQITAVGLTFDFASGGAGSHTPGFAALGNKLIFSNNKPTNSGIGANSGSEVWITDGTGAGTTLLKDIIPGLGSSNPHNFITVGSSVFFQATNGNGSVELWKTDGSTNGTVLVETLFAGGFSPGGGSLITTLNIENMSVQNGVLYFSFDDQVHGSELWRSDGTAAGTLMLKDLNTGFADQGFSNSYTNYAANLGATGVFVGWSQQTGYELFTSNGTPGGTTLVKDIDPGGGTSTPSQFTVAGNKAYFSAFSPTSGIELWVTDGTAAGTVMVKDINPGLGHSNPTGMVAFGNTVYFSADDGNHGQELWVTNGTAAGTYIVADIDPGFAGGSPRSGSPGGFVLSGSQIFFTASTSGTGRELWVTNGTQAGTHITADIFVGPGEAGIYSNIIAYNNKVFFQATGSGAASKGTEVWMSDGTPGGTVVLKDINLEPNGTGGTNSSAPTDFVLANGLFFFRAQTTGSVTDVYRSDGTDPGTLAVTSGLSSVGTLVAAGTKAYFTAQGASGQELYVTSGGAATLIDIVPGPTGSNAQNPVAFFGNYILFTATNTAANGQELWISDGTPGGTTMVKNINPNPSAGSNPSNFVVIGNRAFFLADDGTNGQELWVTDGTSIGTFMIKNIGPGSTGGSVNPIKALDNGHLLFLASDGVSGGSELWITDGSLTLANTFKVTHVIQPAGSFSGPSFVPLNGGGATLGSFATVPYTLPAGATGETFNGTDEAEYFDGLGGNDIINGFGGDDTLLGGANNDTLTGGAGNDWMSGGTGDDVFFVDSSGDFIVDGNAGGNDRVATSVTYALDGNAEIETLETTALSGTSAINLTGNTYIQTIIGNNGNNVLDGFVGNDTLIGAGGNDSLIGGAGNDTMYGGLGNDVYFVDSAGDIIVELSGEGNDRVAVSVSFILSAGASIETLETTVLASVDPLNLTGNTVNQFIIGNNGNNMLQGGGGNDHMIGAGGNDTFVGNSSAGLLEGGLGNDVYFIIDGSDLVIELSGQGNDRAAVNTSYVLGTNAEVETLETFSLAGTSAFNLTGNLFGQLIVGNNGNNTIDGKGGADVLVGAGGTDTFAFTSALGGANVDSIEGFVSGQDKIALDDAIFTALSGSLPAGAFRAGAAAGDADDRIIYNSANGALYYDPDGTGAAAQTQFATLSGGVALVAGDFLVI